MYLYLVTFSVGGESRNIFQSTYINAHVDYTRIYHLKSLFCYESKLREFFQSLFYFFFIFFESWTMTVSRFLVVSSNWCPSVCSLHSKQDANFSLWLVTPTGFRIKLWFSGHNSKFSFESFPLQILLFS